MKQTCISKWTGLGTAAVDDGTTVAEARRNAESIAYIQAVEILAEAIQGIAAQGKYGFATLQYKKASFLSI